MCGFGSLVCRPQWPRASASCGLGGSVWPTWSAAPLPGPDTIYHLASLTKPYGSTVLLQLVDEHRLDLDAPVSRFGIAIERSRPVKVWHLLSHTSGEPPGMGYRYDGNAFGALTQVIERTTGRLFVQELVDRIIRPLGLAETAPNPGDPPGYWSLLLSLTVSAEDVERGRSSLRSVWA